MKTQPGVGVTLVLLFVSMALQLDLEMSDSTAAAGGAQLSGKMNTQARTGVLHFANAQTSHTLTTEAKIYSPVHIDKWSRCMLNE